MESGIWGSGAWRWGGRDHVGEEWDMGVRCVEMGREGSCGWRVGYGGQVRGDGEGGIMWVEKDGDELVLSVFTFSLMKGGVQ